MGSLAMEARRLLRARLPECIPEKPVAVKSRPAGPSLYTARVVTRASAWTAGAVEPLTARWPAGSLSDSVSRMFDELSGS